MHLDTILTLISERENTAAATAGRLRDQINLLTGELDRAWPLLSQTATGPIYISRATPPGRPTRHMT